MPEYEIEYDKLGKFGRPVSMHTVTVRFNGTRAQLVSWFYQTFSSESFKFQDVRRVR